MSSVPVGWTRPSDAERDRALAILRDGAGSGRLSHDTFIRRMNLALRSQSRAELADLIRDLPRGEARFRGWARTVRAKLPRIAVLPGSEPTGALRTPGTAASRGILGYLPKLTQLRSPEPEPLPALALPAPGSPTVRIGRGPGATLRLADDSVSRAHAELRHVGDRWLLRDLGSMNGTWVNDSRITTTVRVRPGDRVAFGAVEFTFTWVDQPQ
ncbi:DUF1707 and FHA domain-containing protein [Kribbella sp. NPDC048915]|uniref:DUF1707 and FHA domain-containing protein n=1 Tax=Kribbella sp. NPDC048915 TaxID=3155148 RepID=UPI0033F68794